MTFAAGDHVKPKPQHKADHAGAEVPTGPVRAAHPFDEGQVLFVGESKRPFLSGYFDLDEGQG